MPKAKAPTHTLIIWQDIPENLKLAIVPNDILDENDFATLALAHGCIINVTDMDDDQHAAVDCISNAFCERLEHLSDAHPKGSKWAMRFKDYVHDPDARPLTGVSITRVFQMGFAL